MWVGEYFLRETEAMRQTQKNNNSNNHNNNRPRGRGGRKPSNPMSRSYDSNGPDVKIRGTANHIAEKYQNLARDASVSGDIVMAENYFQHAEHYLRIIAAAQPAPREDYRQNNHPSQGEHSNNDRNNHRSNQPAVTENSPSAPPVTPVVHVASVVPVAPVEPVTPVVPEIAGNEPQPEISEPQPKPRTRAKPRPKSKPRIKAAETTDVEMDVVEPIPGEGEQPVIEPVVKADEEASAPAAPRRRRRTTYRSRKRPAADNASESAAKSAPDAPQPASADD